MKHLLWPLLAVLLFLHQDYWQWDDATLHLGFLPQALAYHACLSIAAAIFWALACQFCWPMHDEPSTDSEKRCDASATASCSAPATATEELPS